MSRPTVVRRLTAVLALLAVFCLALPAAAIPGAQGQSHRAVHASSLVDQLVAWIGSFWAGPAQGQAAPAEKAIQILGIGIGIDNAAPSPTSSDHGGMIDPNG